MKVSTGNVQTNTDAAEIVVVPAQLGAPRVKMFNVSGHQLDDDLFVEDWWRGPYDVAAGYDATRAAAGTNRRATVQPIDYFSWR